MGTTINCESCNGTGLEEYTQMGSDNTDIDVYIDDCSECDGTGEVQARMLTAQEKSIEKFQCPGCTLGHNTRCGSYFGLQLMNKGPNASFRCEAHRPGTFAMPGGRVYLGLPRGFSKVGPSPDSTELWLLPEGTRPKFDDLNIPVWAMERDDHLFVKVAMPRTCRYLIYVIPKGSRRELVPNVFDVSAIYDAID